MRYKGAVLASLTWNSAHWMGLTVVVGLIAAVLVGWLYWPQTRTTSRRWRWILPALRVMALLLLLLSLLKPTLIRARAANEQGAVVLLVDASRSMGVADREMQVPQQMALADSLGLLPAGSRVMVGQRLRELLEAFGPQLEEAQRRLADLEYARLSGRGAEAAHQRLEETLERATNTASNFKAAAEPINLDPSLKGELANIAKWPQEALRAAWARKSGEVAWRAARRVGELQAEADRAKYQKDPAVRRVCEDLAAQPRLRLAEQAVTAADRGLLDRLPAQTPLFGFSFAGGATAIPLRAGEQPVRRLPVEASGRRSDLEGAIAAALESVGGREIAAVVVFSDGRQAGVGAGAAIRGTPVFTVLCGGENSIKDLSIESVETPAAPFVGETLTVKARLRSLNLGARELEVSARLGAMQQTRKVSVNAGEMITAAFEFKLEKSGVQDLEVSVPGLPGEASTENNRARRPVKVHADRVRVAAITGFPGWDYQYLRNAISRAAWGELSERIVDSGDTLSLSPEALSRQQVILLYSVPARSLSDAQIEAIHSAVTRQGASVLLYAEDVAILDEYARHPLLVELLPYRAGQRPAWRSWAGDTAVFRIAPAPGMESAPALRLADDEQQSRQQWAQAAGFFHYLDVPELKPNVVGTLLAEQGTKSPVLTESRLGLGRIFFVGVNETWRWRRNVGERDHDRLWLQLIRYAAETPYTVVDGRLAMDVDRVTAMPGESVKVRLRVDGEGFAQGDLPRPQLRIYRQDQLLREERLDAASQYGPGRFETQLRDLAEGEYRVEASLGEIPGEGARKLSLPLAVRVDEAAEMANLSADGQHLRQLAASTGGEMVSLDRVAELPRKIAQLHEEAVQTVEIRLWDSWLLFLLVLSLLGVEWAMRKRLGLP